MSSPGKAKGDRGEREVEALLRELLDTSAVRRELGAGRRDDRGDIDGVPRTCIQVTWRKDLSAAITDKVIAVEQQRKNRRVPFAATFVRRSRNRLPWIVVLSPQQWALLWKYAQKGYDLAQKERRAKMTQ